MDYHQWGCLKIKVGETPIIFGAPIHLKFFQMRVGSINLINPSLYLTILMTPLFYYGHRRFPKSGQQWFMIVCSCMPTLKLKPLKIPLLHLKIYLLILHGLVKKCPSILTWRYFVMYSVL